MHFVRLFLSSTLKMRGQKKIDTNRLENILHLFTKKNYLLCGNKMPTRHNRGFYCRSYCLLNMFRAPLCPSSGAQEYYTVVASCGISCCGFSSRCSGAELRVMCPVCRMLACLKSNDLLMYMEVITVYS